MGLSLWGDAGSWLDWSPLGKPTGSMMGRGQKRTHEGCLPALWWEPGIHPCLTDPGIALGPHH